MIKFRANYMGSKNQNSTLPGLITALKKELQKDDLHFNVADNVYKLAGNSYREIRSDKYNDTHKYSVIELSENVFISLEIEMCEQKINKVPPNELCGLREWESKVKERLLKDGSRYFEVFISVSFFIHNKVTGTHTRIIRAEWDTRVEEKHPQPHWHFCLNEINEQKSKDFNEYLKASDDHEQKSKGFNESLEVFDDHEWLHGTKQNKARIEKFHFAMAADSMNGWNDQHRSLSPQNITSWFMWLLKQTKKQFEYIKKKDAKG